MTTYQDRARRVLKYFAELSADYGYLKAGGEPKREFSEYANFDKNIDQALSELASIVEEEKLLARIDELNGVYIVNGSRDQLFRLGQDKKELPAVQLADRLKELEEQRDQLSNRKDD